jgi:hypothetical protein
VGCRFLSLESHRSNQPQRKLPVPLMTIASGPVRSIEDVQPDVRILILASAKSFSADQAGGQEFVPGSEERSSLPQIVEARQAGCAICQRYLELGSRILGEMAMKRFLLVLSLFLCTCSFGFAQVSGGSSAGSSAGAGGTAAGSTLSTGSTVSRTGGSPGPNTSNALGHGTTGNNLGAPQTGVAPGTAASRDNAVDTPAANAATQSLGNTDAGVLKK